MVLYHDYEGEFQEATRDDVVQLGRVYKSRPSPYEVYMEEENIPIYREIGVYDARQLPLAPWKRMGGQGTFLQLDGSGGKYAVEVPAGGALNPERHMYEELFLVIEGRGSTEVWREGSSKRLTFEWQPYSAFAIPLNVWHRLVNATSSPALVLASTNAPAVISLFPTRSYIFENAHEFPERYDESEDYFKPQLDKFVGTEVGKAVVRTNLIPDVSRCYLPLVNLRGAGHRRLGPQMAGRRGGGFIAEYPIGRYSMAHYHASGPTLVCLRGKGYTYTWPFELGKRPWEAGKGHLVKRQDYIPGGMVSAAPGGGNWYHQHFGCGSDVFRVMNIGGGGGGDREHIAGLTRKAGDEVTYGENVVPYPREDPHIRKEYQETLARDGVEFTMPESVYREETSPAGLNVAGL
ncbi:MAG: cupin domain-containing protein [Dehalococcoidales bacterium]|nr:cupin domain-containing protein [Dehalococcoidales bacterium]